LSVKRLFQPGTPLSITGFSARFGSGGVFAAGLATLGAVAGGSWPIADTAFFIPIELDFNYPVRRIFWGNGSAVSGTVDAGIYRSDGMRMISTGGVAMAGTNSLQYVDCQLLLTPGSYYLALTSSVAGIGALFQRTTNGGLNVFRSAGLLQQASARPLPSTMSPAAVTNAYWPLLGITRTLAGF
jgi:hypothetical protein